MLLLLTFWDESKPVSYASSKETPGFTWRATESRQLLDRSWKAEKTRNTPGRCSYLWTKTVPPMWRWRSTQQYFQFRYERFKPATQPAMDLLRENINPSVA